MAASAAGAVRVRPTGESVPPAREAEPVVGRRAQAPDVGLDGVVGGGGRGGGALGDDGRERLVLGDLPAHLGVRAEPGAGYGLGVGRHPGPQQDAVGQRVAGGDAVQEGGGLGGGAGGQCGGERARRGQRWRPRP